MDITIFTSENRRIHFEISKLFTRAYMLNTLTEKGHIADRPEKPF